MTVELTYTGDVTTDEQTAETTIGEVLDLDGTSSSTSGTYHAERCGVQPEREGDGYMLHIGLSLRDADDSDYPNVKDDLASTVAGLTAVDATASEVEAQLTGSVA